MQIIFLFLFLVSTSAALDKRTVDPAQATASLVAALPASIQALALTNPTSAAAEISSELVGSTLPAWFTALPTEVQTYFITQGEAAATSAPAVSPPAVSLSSALPSISSLVKSVTTTATDNGNSLTTIPVGTSGASTGISTGARIGIGVGVSIAAILVLIGIFIIYKRWQRKEAARKAEEEREKAEQDNKGAIPGYAELGTGREAAELPAPHGVSELSGQRQASGFVEA